IVALPAEPADEAREEEHVQPDLPPRGTGAHRAAEVRPARPEDAGIQARRRLADAVGQDVDLMPLREQLARAVIGAERCAPGSIEGLWDDLEDSHASVVVFVRFQQAARPCGASYTPITHQRRASSRQHSAKLRRKEVFELVAPPMTARLAHIGRGCTRMATDLDGRRPGGAAARERRKSVACEELPQVDDARR